MFDPMLGDVRTVSRTSPEGVCRRRNLHHRLRPARRRDSGGTGSLVKQLHDSALSIFTDGSGLHGPRTGGIGIVFVWTGEDGSEQTYEESPPGYQQATNNQMEIQAAIEALKLAKREHMPFDLAQFDRITIYSDAQYLTDNYGTALNVWSRNGWRLSGGGPVHNIRAWKELLRTVKGIWRDYSLRVSFEWVKGHKSEPHNKRADKLAGQSARSAPRRGVLQPARVRRKLTPNEIEVGSVGIEGQEIEVRIISDEWVPPPHRCYRFNYEVMDETSPYFQRADKITSEHALRAGHVYVVQFNDDPKNPQILDVIREVEK